jgi:hypothetical protein
VHGVTLFVAVNSPISCYFSISFSVTAQSSDNTFLEKCGLYSCRKYWNYVLGNKNMTVMHNMNEITFNSRFVYIAHIDVFFPRSNYMTSWQSSLCATLHHSFITRVVIQHLVSDRLLSLILTENLHNVR